MMQTQTLPFSESSFSRKEVIAWWEQRRLSYNSYVLLVGVASWLLVLVAGDAAVKPGVDFEEPLAMVFGPGVYLAIANLCYTLGWVVDITFYRGSPREKLFRTGLVFSIVLTALPGTWAVLAWLITLHTGQKLD
jgi:hypothetical protein